MSVLSKVEEDYKVVAYMVGYDPGYEGGPWELVAGHPLWNQELFVSVERLKATDVLVDG